MKRSAIIILLLNCYAILSNAQTGRAGAADLAWIRQTMKQYMAEHDIPALTAGIVREDRVETIISEGTLRRGSGPVIDGNTIFQLASVSKTFTGLLANHLAAEGHIDLDAAINGYLPATLSGAARARLAHLTLRDLLHHRAGLPRNAPSLQKTPNGRPLTRAYTEAELLQDLENLDLDPNAKPAFSYSNFGYGLAGFILENASGQSYEQLLQTYIAQKNGMVHTTSLLTEVRQDQLVTPYLPHQRRKETQAWIFGKMAPAGGLFSTVNDLCILMTRQMEAYRQYEQTGQACPLILTLDKRPMGAGEYGFGLIESRNTVDTTIIHLSHGGDLDGFVSNYSFSPNRGVGLVLLSSSGGAWFWELERLLMMKLLGLPIREVVSLDRKVLKRYEGQYDFGHLVLTISRKGDQLYTQTPGYPKQKLYPEAENKFFYHAFDGQIEFVLTDDKRIEKVIYTQDGKTAYPRKIK